MSRFYVPKDSIKGKTITISGKEAHHILEVMRFKVSDKVVTFDGTGKEYTGIIKNISRKSLEVEITGTRKASSEEGIDITLIQAIPKKEKMDYIVEKSTELGVASVIPIFTERTIPDWDADKRSAQAARWRKIALEASKQCGRADVPKVDEIKDTVKVMKELKVSGLKLIAVLSDEAMPLKDVLKDNRDKNIVVAIGPEGDFTPHEIDEAKAAGFKLVSLGPRVLKSDTAGLAALAAINYEYSK